MFKRYALFGIIISLTALFLVGCDPAALTVVEYNNEVVEILNKTSAKIEESTVLYDETIPNIVTENSTIDVTKLKTVFDETALQVEAAKIASTLTSRDPDQQTQVREGFWNYLTFAETYLTNYEEMINYYVNNEFKENLDGVSKYDQDLHVQYNDFIESNNTLVDILSQYVK